MKFGGGVLKGAESFSKIADQIAGKRVVVVVSAMSGMTDQLIEMAKKVHESPPKRELDMLISVGERMSIALLAMALAKKGVEAVSFTGSQSGIITTSEHQEARIIDVRPMRLVKALDQGKVVIVAGFQGVSLDKEITTLGRGGSDTTAVALAIALQGDLEFVKDVPGIYRNFPDRALLEKELTHEEATAIVSRTGKVLHVRALELAKKNGLPFLVRGLVRGAGTVVKQINRANQLEPIYEEPLPTYSHAL